MANAARPRLEWTPGSAAQDALAVAERLYPHLSRPALIDYLVINGFYALRQPPWQPPRLYGSDRDEWQLPRSLKSDAAG